MIPLLLPEDEPLDEVTSDLCFKETNKQTAAPASASVLMLVICAAACRGQQEESWLSVRSLTL